MKKKFYSLKKIFDSHQSFVITTHVNPDGDAIGSEVALALMLKKQGKKVVIVNQSETPDHLLFLTKLFPVHTYSAKYNKQILTCDCFCVVDTNSPNRFSAMAETVARSKAVKVCIDHHLEHDPFADFYLIDTEVPATCELLYRVFRSYRSVVIQKPIAEALYTGIMTDTASFRFPKTDSETHRIIADLLSYGINQYGLYQKVYESGPLNKLWLLGKALESIQLHHQDKVAAMILTRRIFDETKTKESDVDNFTSYVLSVKNVVVGLVFVELRDGVKVSFRSKGNIAVNKLAQQFGGGGHKNAAGARLKNISLDEAIAKVLTATSSYV